MFAEHLERRLLLISPELDFSFGAGGISSLDFWGGFYDFRLLPDGKIIAAGVVDSHNVFIARYRADGLLDTTFDGDGMVNIPVIGNGDGMFAPDGKLTILFAREGNDHSILQRFNSDGSADSSFGSNGSVELAMLVRSAVVLPDGRMILTGGKFGTPQIVVRLNVDGSVDESFRGGIAAAVPLPEVILVAEGVTIGPDAKIYFTGEDHVDGVSQTFIGRLGADGTPDTSFGGGGLVDVRDPALPTVIINTFPYPYVDGAGIEFDAQGRLVVLSELVVGSSDRRKILTRFTTTGARDTSFGGGDAWVDLGVQSFPSGLDRIFTPDGKTLVAAESALTDDNLSLRRFNSDGTLDTTFGDGGVAEYFRDTLVPHHMLFDQSGNLLIAGTQGPTIAHSFRSALARLIPVSDNVFLNAEGVLSIDGTDGHDTVSLERSGSQVILRRNGAMRTFAASAVKKLVFWGYAGNDTVTVSFALDAEVYGFAGDDAFTLGDGIVTIDAGDGAATIVAGDGQHEIVVGDGHNSIRVGSGKDSITAGSGNDTIITGDGADSILAGDGDDSIATGDGNDTIYTGNGNDEVAAGAGNDIIQAFESQTPFDSLDGPELDPLRDGGNGRKLYFGGAGDDFLVGGSEGSRLFGGEGADEIYSNAGDDSITAGGGNDTVSASDGNDLLLGGDGDDSLYGSAGNDTLDGGAGDDSLDAGTGDDVLDGLPDVSVVDGVLSFDGTEGDDVISISKDDDSGNFVVWLDGSIRQVPAGDVTRIALFGNGGNDVLKVHRFVAVEATLNGGSGDDVLLGGAGSDVLRGGDGDDYLSAFAGDDYLDGGRGADALRGGDGKDELDYSSRTANLVIGLDGFQDDGEAGERDYAAPDIERVVGGSGNDRIGGGPGLNLLYGEDGNDTLSGGADDAFDGLYGGGGNDRLDGGGGNDYLEGGAGHDLLHGGLGADQLFGLAGNDLFLAKDAVKDIVRGGTGTDEADVDSLDDVLAAEIAL